MTMRIAVAISGRGSNLEALLHALEPGAPAEVALVLSDRSAPGLDLARARQIPAVVLTDSADGDEWLALLGQHRIELLVLAGYLKLVPSVVIGRYRGCILNIHPALLPDFGGKGMYGRRVHQAVLDSGARESGATVHLVDEAYDHGATLAQARVPVLPGDTPERLAERVLQQEHRLLPAVVLAAARAGRVVGLKESPVPSRQPPGVDSQRRLGTGDSRLTNMPRALISVSDKRGVVAFARGLADLGWEIISTGGTAAALRSGDVPVIEVEKLTGFPELLDGRVKTLHPMIHGALLARRDLPEHVAALERHKIAPIDLVAVNLYPFQLTISNQNATLEDALENIDVGGPSMLRSAAKNHESVLPVVTPRTIQWCWKCSGRARWTGPPGESLPPRFLLIPRTTIPPLRPI